MKKSIIALAILAVIKLIGDASGYPVEPKYMIPLLLGIGIYIVIFTTKVKTQNHE